MLCFLLLDEDVLSCFCPAEKAEIDGVVKMKMGNDQQVNIIRVQADLQQLLFQIPEPMYRIAGREILRR